MRANAGKDDQYERLVSEANKFYFILYEGQKINLGTSEFFDTEDYRNTAIEILKKIANSAVAIDN